MSELATPAAVLTRARARVGEAHVFWVGTAVVAAGLGAVLAWLLREWPPHEDEALALFVGRSSLVDMLDTVVTERGGAPFHFVIAWLVVHLDGGLTALRAVSLVFAIASVPLIALLGARLADRTTGLVAAVLAAASWMLLFSGVFGRMYSLFLFTSLVSFLALLSALDTGRRRTFVLWGFALVAMLATHPYAVFVVGAQALFVLLRRSHVRDALVTLGAVGVIGAPFWWANIILRDRFDVGLGGGGSRLGSPGSVVEYFWWVVRDFGVGPGLRSVAVLVLMLVGAGLLLRQRRDGVLLAACVVVVPALAFLLATAGSTASPESRHLIYALPFFSVLLAVALVAAGRRRPPLTTALAVAAVAALVVGELSWAQRKTPLLFDGDPPGEARARDSAATWLASTGRANDVLLGYEPVYLRAWEQNRALSIYTLPRADPALLTAALNDVPQPLGRGVWLFDASDSTNTWQRQRIPVVRPRPHSAFEARVWGPYLVIRSRRSLVTRARYVAVSKDVLRLGRSLQIGDADINLRAILQAESGL